jgi:putative transposase
MVAVHRTGQADPERHIESFNGRLRDECLNVEVFFTIIDVREKLERWRTDYNQVRPHSALNDQSPADLRYNLGAERGLRKHHTLAGVVRSAAAANPEPGQLFVRPSVAMKGAAEKLVSEGSSINDNPGVLREVLT